MAIVLISFLLATGKFILICRFLPIRKVLYFDKWVDLFFTVILPIAFYGTFSGMLVAIFSGLFLSLYLLVAKLALGSERPKFMGPERK